MKTNLFDELTEEFKIRNHTWEDITAILCKDEDGKLCRLKFGNFVDCAKKHNYNPEEWGEADIPTSLQIHFEDMILFIREYDGTTAWISIPTKLSENTPIREINSLKPEGWRDLPQFVKE